MVKGIVTDHEAYFRTVFEGAAVGIAITSPNGQILDSNLALQNFLKYTRKELNTMNFRDYTYHQDLDQDLELLQKMLAGELSRYKLEKRYIRKDGVVVWGRLTTSLVNSGEERQWIIAMIEDITNYKVAQEALAQSRELYRSLIEYSRDAVFVVSPEGTYLQANPAACKMLGYTKEEMLQLAIKDVVPPEVVEEGLRIFKQFKQQGFLFQELMLKTKEGRYMPVEINANVLPNGNFLGMVRDLTERKEADKLLKESEERYRLLFETSPEAILVLQEGIIVIANMEAVKLFGFTRIEELIGKPILSFLHPSYLEIVRERIREVLEEKKFTPFIEEKIIRVDGGVLDVEVLAIPFTYQEEAAVQLLYRDITSRKLMEEEAFKASKLESLGILAGGIAHDFNNILTIILGNIFLAKLNVRSEAKIYQRLKEIEEACQQAKNLTQQLLTFSKGGEPVKKTVDINSFIKEAATFALSGSNLRAEFDLPGDLYPVDIDEGQIRQVVNNLIINANQAMPEGGTIYLKVESIWAGSDITCELPLQPGAYVKLMIKDEGHGIPPKYLSKIFDPYFTTKQTGSGLGLTTSYSIVKKHDGHIMVESEMGRGTVFYIYLPVSSQQDSNNRDKEENILNGRGRVLIMDDEKNIREVVGEMLTNLGYEVDYAQNGAEAITLYKRAQDNGNPFTVVIMDLTVPGGMGGKEAVKELLKFDSHVKTIVSSGYFNDPVLARFKEYGFKGFVAKPFSLEELSKVIREVTDEDYTKQVKMPSRS